MVCLFSFMHSLKYKNFPFWWTSIYIFNILLLVFGVLFKKALLKTKIYQYAYFLLRISYFACYLQVQVLLLLFIVLRKGFKFILMRQIYSSISTVYWKADCFLIEVSGLSCLNQQTQTKKFISRLSIFDWPTCTFYKKWSPRNLKINHLK